MVLPLIPIAIAAAAGAGGAGLGSLMGGKKETTQTTYAPTTTYGAKTYAPTQTYAPQISYAYQGPTIISDSPYASSKKEVEVQQESKPNIVPSFNIPTTSSPDVGGGLTQGTDMVMLAAIAAIAVIGGSYFMGGKK